MLMKWLGNKSKRCTSTYPLRAKQAAPPLGAATEAMELAAMAAALEASAGSQETLGVPEEGSGVVVPSAPAPAPAPAAPKMPSPPKRKVVQLSVDI